MRKTVLLLLLSAAAGYSQYFTFGVRGGVPLSDAFKVTDRSTFSSDTSGYTFGPTAELHGPFRLSLSLDMLYRSFEYESETLTGTGIEQVSTGRRTTGRSWQVPLMVRHRFWPLLSPFVAAGVSFQRLSGLNQRTTVTTALDPQPQFSQSSEPVELQSRSSTGFVFGAGLEFRALLITVAPEVRYTRWASEPVRSAGGGLRSGSNQTDFLIGLTF